MTKTITEKAELIKTWFAGEREHLAKVDRRTARDFEESTAELSDERLAHLFDIVKAAVMEAHAPVVVPKFYIVRIVPDMTFPERAILITKETKGEAISEIERWQGCSLENSRHTIFCNNASARVADYTAVYDLEEGDFNQAYPTPEALFSFSRRLGTELVSFTVAAPTKYAAGKTLALLLGHDIDTSWTIYNIR